MENKQLPQGWFSPQDISVYRNHLTSLPDKAKIVEVGVWKGRSICSVADIVIAKKLKVYAVDTFEGSEGEDAHLEADYLDIETEFRNSIEAFGLTNYVTIFRGTSLEFAKKNKRNLFDLAFIDADHSREAVKNDFIAYSQIAKVVIGHDYHWDSVRLGIEDCLVNYRQEADSNIWSGSAAAINLVIPTWKGESLVKNAVASIAKNTSDYILQNVLKVTIVSNNEDTAANYFHDRVRINNVFEYNKGFANASNAGALSIDSDITIFFNDDCEVLDFCDKDVWLSRLVNPLLYDAKVGATGALWNRDEHLKFNFLVGFLLAVKTNIFKDTMFSVYEWGGAEDAELCYRIMAKGYAIKNVNENNDYPIYHAAEGTLHDEEHYDKWVNQDILGKNFNAMHEKLKAEGVVLPKKERPTITAVVPTKNRYETTLPITLSHILCQTVKPNELIVFDDNEEPKDIREWETIGSILKMYEQAGIQWYWLFSKRVGAWASHLESIKQAKSDFIWRVDDDCFPSPDVLEKLVSHVDDSVAAVGGSVLHLGKPYTNKPLGFTNKLAFIDSLPNAQWFNVTEVTEAEHLYSTFIYRREAALDIDFPELSNKSFREETILSVHLSTKGKLLVVPAVTYHAMAKGGIRSDDNNSIEKFNSDQQKYEQFLEKIGKKPKGKLFVAANGKGDSENLLEVVRQYDGDAIIFSVENAVDVFDGYEVYNSFDSKNLGIDFSKYNLYEWMAQKNWNKSVLEAYKEVYG